MDSGEPVYGRKTLYMIHFLLCSGELNSINLCFMLDQANTPSTIKFQKFHLLFNLLMGKLAECMEKASKGKLLLLT